MGGSDGAAALAPNVQFEYVVKTAMKKAQQPLATTLVLSFMAGCYISFGGLFMTAVGCNMPALAASDPGMVALIKGVLFNFGLAMVLLAGAELFTSNTFYMLAGWLNGAVTLRALSWNWCWSYMGNFVGSLFVAFLSDITENLSSPDVVSGAIALAEKKAHVSFGKAIAKGIMCNWMVCLAVWCSIASPTVTGKLVAIFFPITAFVAIGYEHSVANMFLIPQGIIAGGDISIIDFLWGNEVPVTIGNILGSAIFVTSMAFLAFSEKSPTGVRWWVLKAQSAPAGEAPFTPVSVGGSMTQP